LSRSARIAVLERPAKFAGVGPSHQVRMATRWSRCLVEPIRQLGGEWVLTYRGRKYYVARIWLFGD
jgi:hypothetical protein